MPATGTSPAEARGSTKGGAKGQRIKAKFEGQLLFLMDVTGSMQSSIDACKAKIRDLVAGIQKDYPELTSFQVVQLILARISWCLY